MQLTILIILSLACYRVTRFVIADSLIDVTRLKVHQFLLGTTARWRRRLYELLTCPYCLSIWVAAGMIIVTDLFTHVNLPIFSWLATSAGSLIVWSIIED